MSGRLIDIPYKDTVPILFTFQQTATVAAGVYTFASGNRTAFTPNRPIRGNVLYWFQTLDFAFDVFEGDYQGGISGTLTPTLSIYQSGNANAPELREPIPLPKYLENFDYPLSFIGMEQQGSLYAAASAPATAQPATFNRFMGSIIGEITQTAALLGKATLTATAIFSVLEISNETFIREFRQLASPKDMKDFFNEQKDTRNC